MTPLHSLGTWLREACALLPLELVRGVFVLIPLGLLVWVWRLPRACTTPSPPTRHWHEDLRIWATVALALQAAIYVWLA